MFRCQENFFQSYVKKPIYTGRMIDLAIRVGLVNQDYPITQLTEWVIRSYMPRELRWPGLNITFLLYVVAFCLFQLTAPKRLVLLADLARQNIG
jgi:hypothetical protein